MQKEKKRFFKSERQKTDKSLHTERGRTDESFEAAKRTTEHKTDKYVRKVRQEADQSISSSRVEADTQRDHYREMGGYDEAEDRQKSDNRIKAERHEADQTTRQQRSEVDTAMDREREIKNNLMSQLLKDERGQTDQSLKDERTQTDSEVNSRSALLSKEILAHSKTKISLTTRDEFLAIVSHDLRNPVGAIYSCAEMLLEDDLYKGMDTEVKHWIGFMKRNADTALRLISDILDMERIAEGKLQIKMGYHDINKILRDSVESFSHAASARRILLRLAPNKVKGEVFCDRDRIMQVLSNLIGNAVKFTPEGGAISVGVDENENEVRFFVSDTGPGVPEEMKDHIFDRFAQIGSKDRTGLGLGLYISRMMVEAHKGKLSLESKHGHGSTFSFFIPKQNQADISKH